MPQEDLTRVMEALRKADAAGNTEDARKLATIADHLRESSQQPEPQRQDMGVMPFANRAIAQTLGAPADIVGKGLSLIPGVDIPEPFGGTKSIERGMGAIGARLPEKGRVPETLPEYVGTGIGEVASLMLPMGAATKLLSRGAGLTGKIASSIVQSMGKHPWITMTSELTGGMGAGAGRGIGGQAFPESQTKRTISEVVGGVAGGMAPTLALQAPSILALRGGKTLLRKISMPYSERGAKYRAGEFLKSQVTDPEAIARRTGEPTIGDLPPAVQAGEKRLTTLYKSLAGQDPALDADTIETLSKSIIKLEKEMRKLGHGAPDLLAEITQKRIAALELKIDRRIVTAMDSARKKLDSLPIAQRKGAESQIVRNEIETVMRQERTAMNKLWGEVPKDFEIGFDKTRQVYGDILDDLAQAQKVDVPSPLRTSSILNDAKLAKTNIREMQGLRSKLLEAARQARQNSRWNKARIADEVADAILEDIGIAAGGATTPEAAKLQAALGATKQFKTRFESGVVGKILGYGKTGAPAISPDLTLDISIGRMGQKGAIDINKIAITPDAVKATEKYLARSYTDYALDRATGRLNPIKSERWIKTNEAILDKFPSLRSQLADAGEAQKLANNTNVAMEARKQALKNPKISTSARFLNAADMGREIETILKSKNPARMANELTRQAGKDATGEALEGLRGGFVDHILEKSSIGAFNELGEQTLSGRTLLNFVKRNESTLRQVFTPEQISRMRTVGNELAKIEVFEKAAAGKPDIEMKDIASSALKLFSRVGGAQIGRWVARMTGGGTVQTPGIFSERFKSFANFLSKDRAFQMIHDAVLSKDPKLLQSLLLPIDKPGTKLTNDNLRILNERMNFWLAGSGKRVMDNLIDELNEDSEKTPIKRQMKE
jgi:hypothetical protein